MITLLAGGVGGARLLRGLARVVPHAELTVIVNTGDDDEFYGLNVSPDLDTIIYTLADMAPLERGWGIDGDTFRVREELDRLTGKGWFALGDRDIATHVFRTSRLRDGAKLTEVTAEICKARGINVRVLPMTDHRVRTEVLSDRGILAFQDYLVRLRAEPKVKSVRYRGARRAAAAAGVIESIDNSALVIIAPSNPFVSIGPILALPGVKPALTRARDRVVAVSPLIAGHAVKGPLADMLSTMGRDRDGVAIADFYKGLATRLVVAPGDRPRQAAGGLMEYIEHDILLLEPRRAERLAKFLCALAVTH